MLETLSKFLIKPPDLAGLKPGEAGEEWVAYLYRLKGHRIIARNYAVYGKKKLGEIDIVCRAGSRIVIIEVKTRRDERFMSIVEAVDFRKQSFLRRMAKLYLQQNPEYQDHAIQIDVAAVLIDPFDNHIRTVKIVENAIADSV